MADALQHKNPSLLAGTARPISLEASPRVEWIRTTEGWDALEPEWRELYQACPAAAPPLCWEWIRCWWRLYGPVCAVRSAKTGDEGLRIGVVRSAGALIGILPLYLNQGGGPLQRRRLMLIGTGEDEAEEICAEYLDLLYAPNQAANCVACLSNALASADIADWDAIDLSPISHTSALTGWLQDDSALQCTSIDHGPAYLFDLQGGFEAYLSRLSSNSRGLARKRMRQAVKLGATLEMATSNEDVNAMFDELQTLHQARWKLAGKPGCFTSHRFRAFHLEQAGRGVHSGEAILARLRFEGQTLGVTLGYSTRGKLDVYVSGTRLEEGLAVKSPGIVLQLLLAEHLASIGYVACDHLGGDASYKREYSTHQAARLGLSCERATLRTRLRRFVELAKRPLRKGKSLLTARGEAPLTIEPSPTTREDSR